MDGYKFLGYTDEDECEGETIEDFVNDRGDRFFVTEVWCRDKEYKITGRVDGKLTFEEVGLTKGN